MQDDKEKISVIVTGGAGFIGSNLVRYLINNTNWLVINVDKLTYAGNLESLKDIENNPRYRFEQVDICDKNGIRNVFEKYHPAGLMHLAAESHVDRSIDGPDDFVRTNVLGTFVLLEEARFYWNKLSVKDKERFRFLHVSTDEVFGSLGSSGFFNETTPYRPNSPYSASKASSDHFVRAWYHTYGLPTIITNCSNNYGPYQFPEKLIPVVILSAIKNRKIPVYGKGENVRDWLYVEDHARALHKAFTLGKPGETYLIGGSNERKNIEVVTKICEILDEIYPCSKIGTYKNLIEFVTDRPGHDFRYAINASKIRSELNWQPMESFESGIRKTVKWYLENQQWCENVMTGKYQLQRLGVGKTDLVR